MKNAGRADENLAIETNQEIDDLRFARLQNPWTRNPDSDPGTDPEATARDLFATAKSMLRGADGLELDFHTIGYRPTPIDGFPIIGRAKGVAGLYVAVMHSGITLAPAVGLFATREILDGERDPLLAPYGVERFAQ